MERERERETGERGAARNTEKTRLSEMKRPLTAEAVTAAAAILLPALLLVYKNSNPL